ncbi:tetratricopeptide repeat protein [Allosphingosinicella flava]|uniref:Tetratricopeptide repeat protein n=1 Tax=Allosphingosinicella flava TaxID=2771430 RepID=A0A7T2GKN0_9SPHN|nr:tetratricopeptide repeat protein [Sphingosinicella flava]QPQ55621.1 tetratricopeptide repeat protein [Sphingosinicella flava]
MTSWLIFLLLALAVLAGLRWLGGMRGASLQFALSALLIAAAGYAWQGRPGLREARPAAAAERGIAQTPFSMARKELFGQFDASGAWLTLSDGYRARGDTKGAVDIVRSGLRKYPDNAVLWLGLADALVVHGDGRVTPAARAAFERAGRLAPQHPAPRLFYGMALARSGSFDEAERLWRALLADSPADAPWRRVVEDQLKLVDEAREMQRTTQP